MKKASIIINYKDKEFESHLSEYTDDDFKKLKDIIIKASSGELDYLSFMNKNKEYFFTKQILKKSIITIYTRD